MNPFNSLSEIFALPFNVSYRDWSSGWMPMPVDLDFVPDPGNPTYIILRNGEPPIRFSGERKVSRKKDHSTQHIIGPWSTVNIFKTVGGRFVCQEGFKASQQTEITEYFVEIFDDEQSAANFLARSSLTFDGLLDHLSDCLARRQTQAN